MSTGGPPRVAIFVEASVASGVVVGAAVGVEVSAAAFVACGTAGSGWAKAGSLLSDEASEAVTAAVFVSPAVAASATAGAA